jgi:hypothetical protein
VRANLALRDLFAKVERGYELTRQYEAAARSALEPLLGAPEADAPYRGAPVRPRRRRDQEAPVPRFIKDFAAFVRERDRNDDTGRHVGA